MPYLGNRCENGNTSCFIISILRDECSHRYMLLWTIVVERSYK